MNLQERLNELIHKLGIHKWSEWEYVSPDACEQLRKCSYDGVTQSRVKHQWSEGTPSISNGCCITYEGEPSKCVRCGEMNPVQPPVKEEIEPYAQICEVCGKLLDPWMNV